MSAETELASVQARITNLLAEEARLQKQIEREAAFLDVRTLFVAKRHDESTGRILEVAAVFADRPTAEAWVKVQPGYGLNFDWFVDEIPLKEYGQ